MAPCLALRSLHFVLAGPCSSISPDQPMCPQLACAVEVAPGLVLVRGPEVPWDRPRAHVVWGTGSLHSLQARAEVLVLPQGGGAVVRPQGSRESGNSTFSEALTLSPSSRLAWAGLSLPRSSLLSGLYPRLNPPNPLHPACRGALTRGVCPESGEGRAPGLHNLVQWSPGRWCRG